MSTSPEELLAALADSVTLAAVCVPDPVRLERPRLAPTALRRGIETTSIPAGHEDALCHLVTGPGAERAAREVAESLEQLPFLLFVPTAGGDEGAAFVAARELAAGGAWVMRDMSARTGAVVLAPVERIVDSSALPGDWSPPSDEPSAVAVERSEESAALVRRAVDGDLDALGALARRLAESERAAEIARQRAEQAEQELSRIRGDQQSELDHLHHELLVQREWVREQALRIAASTSWRVGHTLTRLGRRLRFKSDRGTDLPRQIAQRMEQGGDE